jgi:hypothetical protein
MDWPAFFPENAPPNDAVPTAGKVYRIVRQIPPARQDFLSQVEARPHHDFGTALWLACGVSFHTNLEDSQQLRNRHKPWRQRHIATGNLEAGLGAMKGTPSRGGRSHLTVWFQKDAKPEQHVREDAEVTS